MAPLFQALYDGNAEIVLTGHDQQLPAVRPADGRRVSSP
jgi:hypothetical protein